MKYEDENKQKEYFQHYRFRFTAAGICNPINMQNLVRWRMNLSSSDISMPLIFIVKRLKISFQRL
jgi:hypothetical protein